MNNDNSNAVDVTGNKTLAAVDSGVIQNVTFDTAVLTLPAAAAGLVGMTVIARVKGAKIATNGPAGATGNKSVGFSIAPAAADGITGGGLATPVVNKKLLYAKTTSRITDYVRLVCSGVTGTGAWYITGSAGTFTREP